MATKAKRPARPSTKSVKTPVKSKSVAPKASKPKTSSVKKSKRLSESRAFWIRTRFVFYVVLIAAALVAITGGLMMYDNSSDTTTVASSSAGALSLQSLDSTSNRKAGDTVTVTLYEDSGTQAVNALQAGIRYPSEKLEYVSVDTGSAFPQDAATDSSTPGLIRVARSIQPGSPAVKGAKPVVTLSFKVLADSTDPFELTIDEASSLLVRSSDNQNILGTAASTKFEL